MMIIQAISDGTIIDERRCISPPGARKCLLAMIHRHAPTGDQVALIHAFRLAEQWDGRSDFSHYVPNYATNIGVRFVAQEER